MTDIKVREQEFAKAYNELCQQYGVQLMSTVTPRSFGNMLQIEPALQLVAIDNWKDPDPAASPILDIDLSKASNVLPN